MTIGTQNTRPQTTHATHVTKPPRSNRQNLARLEIVTSQTKHSPKPISNRQFLGPSTPLPWIQLQHEAFQLIQTGHSHRTNSAITPEMSPIATPAPQGRHRVARSVRAGKKCGNNPPSAGGATRGAHITGDFTAAAQAAPASHPSPFLISRSAIRNRRNPLKTRGRGDF
jgi:hypothetical protein